MAASGASAAGPSPRRSTPSRRRDRDAPAGRGGPAGGAGGLDRAALIADRRLILEPAAARAYSEAVRRRLRARGRSPILGRKGFRHIDLAVDRRVLVPLPGNRDAGRTGGEVNPDTVLEIGTGSGAIALAVADELAACQVTATDVSDGAIGGDRKRRDGSAWGAGPLHPGLCLKVRPGLT